MKQVIDKKIIITNRVTGVKIDFPLSSVRHIEGLGSDCVMIHLKSGYKKELAPVDVKMLMQEYEFFINSDKPTWEITTPRERT